MRRVHKYALGSADATLSLPVGAEVLAVQLQGGVPQLWVLVDPSVMWYECRRFVTYGTGWDIAAGTLRYVGTWQSDSFVWHLFEQH